MLQLGNYDSIFVAFSGGKNSTAAFPHLLPELQEVWDISPYCEKSFGVTIYRTQSVEQLAAGGKPHSECAHAQRIEEAMNLTWDGTIRIPPEQWTLPAGAFRRSGAPTRLE